MCHDILGRTYISTLDHSFWNEGLDEKILDDVVFHSPDNLSDHSLIYYVLTDGNYCSNSTEDFEPSGISKPR